MGAAAMSITHAIAQTISVLVRVVSITACPLGPLGIMQRLLIGGSFCFRDRGRPGPPHTRRGTAAAVNFPRPPPRGHDAGGRGGARRLAINNSAKRSEAHPHDANLFGRPDFA